MNKDYSEDEQRRYAQELCAAHVQAERELMNEILSNPPDNICRFGFVSKIQERGAIHPLDPRAGKLLKALFLRGEIPRAEIRSIMGMEGQSDRHARRIVSQLVHEGLVCSDSHRAPLRICFPTHVLRYYFPDLFDPTVLGEKHETLH